MVKAVDLQPSIDKVRAMNLHLPTEVGERPEPLFEDEETLYHLARRLKPHPVASHSVVEVPEGQQAHGALIERLTRELHEEFDGTVLRDSVYQTHRSVDLLVWPEYSSSLGRCPKRLEPLCCLGPRERTM